MKPELRGIHLCGEQPGFRLADGDVALRSARIGQRDAVGDIFHRLPLDPDGASGGTRAKGLFFECRLFHQPMGEPPEEVEIGTAVVVAPRPQPGVIREENRKWPFLLAAQDQERQIVGADISADPDWTCDPTIRSHLPQAGGCIS